MNEQPMTVKEVAQFLRIDLYSVYRLLTRGKIVGYKPCGQWRVWKKDVMEYLESKRHRVPERVERRATGPGTVERLRALGVKV